MNNHAGIKTSSETITSSFQGGNKVKTDKSTYTICHTGKCQGWENIQGFCSIVMAVASWISRIMMLQL